MSASVMETGLRTGFVVGRQLGSGICPEAAIERSHTGFVKRKRWRSNSKRKERERKVDNSTA